MTEPRPHAYVLGTSPTGLYAARELRQGGYDVVGVGERRGALGWSRALGGAGSFMRGEPGAELASRVLDDSARRKSPGVVVPSSDAFIEFVVKHRDRLAPQLRFQDCYEPDAYRRIVDKSCFYDACERAGLGIPATRSGELQTLVAAAEGLRPPFLLKPTLIHRVRAWMAGRKVLTAQTVEELAAVADSIPSDVTTDWLLQEVIPGPESNIRLYCAHRTRSGSLVQELSAIKLRQYPPGFGSASLVRVRTEEEVIDRGRALFESLDLKGIGGAEFKRDERDGRLYAIEVNPRPTLWFGATNTARKRLTLSLANELLGRPLPGDSPPDESVLWRYGLKDRVSQQEYARGQCALPAPEITSHVRGTKRSAAVFRWSDPLPALGELGTYAFKARSRYRA